MALIASLITKIFILLLVGWGAAKLGVMDEVTQDKLSGVLVNIALPASMLASSQSAFSKTNMEGMGIIGAMTFIMYAVVFMVGILYQRMRKGDLLKQNIMLLIVAFANTGFLGIPIVTEMVGSTGTLYAVIYNIVFDLIYFSIGLYLLQSSGNQNSENGKKGIDLKVLLGNHMVWVSLAVVILYVIPFRFPAAVTESFDLLGGMMMPISMLIIGAQLSSVKFKELLVCKEGIVLTILRMILVPALTVAAMWLIKPSKEIAYTMILLSAIPSASLNVIMARKYKAYPELATIAVTQNTVVFVVVFPVVCYLLTMMF